MANGRERPRTSPLVFLSLCLSLLAVALSTTALLVVYDKLQLPLGRAAGERPVVPDREWPERIDRVEKYLEGARKAIGGQGEKDREVADDEMRSVVEELRDWVATAEPRMRQAVARLADKAEQARAALRGRSEHALEKLEELRRALTNFRTEVAPAKAGKSSDRTAE